MGIIKKLTEPYKNYIKDVKNLSEEKQRKIKMIIVMGIIICVGLLIYSIAQYYYHFTAV